MDDRAEGGATAILTMVGTVVILAAAAYVFATPKDAPAASTTLQLAPPVAIAGGGIAYNVTGNVTGISWDKIVIKLAGAQGTYGVGVDHKGRTSAVDSDTWKGSVQYQEKTPIVKGDQIVLTSGKKQSGALLVIMQASDQSVLIQQPVNGLG